MWKCLMKQWVLLLQHETVSRGTSRSSTMISDQRELHFLLTDSSASYSKQKICHCVSSIPMPKSARNRGLSPSFFHSIISFQLICKVIDLLYGEGNLKCICTLYTF
ncbi:hypothetical protein EUGRSUZ_C00187 [Eucalyptus grandis]|uniref:Uncharacterized protein n=2 Tax=Eucalyptus grandis TaxID=71139 RepID=A0ACC3LB06_EUCGR|nr:hypothetical protein EUGRSUZ_C00187 [Eucalyptus grandis]